MLVAKGVSDFANFMKSNTHQLSAADAAATFLIDFLKQVSLPPRPIRTYAQQRDAYSEVIAYVAAHEFRRDENRRGCKGPDAQKAAGEDVHPVRKALLIQYSGFLATDLEKQMREAEYGARRVLEGGIEPVRPESGSWPDAEYRRAS